jgi:hypothetical protein
MDSPSPHVALTTAFLLFACSASSPNPGPSDATLTPPVDVPPGTDLGPVTDQPATPDALTTPDVTPGPDASVTPDATVPACRGVSLVSDGVLDLDVRAVRVRGSLTVNGAPLSSGAADRGSLTFTERRTGIARARVAMSGNATYDLLVAPGTYDIRYVPPTGLLCGQTDNLMPCVGATVRAGIALTADGVLDLNLDTVNVRGTVTLNGAPMPDATFERGALQLMREGGGEARVSLGTRGSATWSARVIRGTYSIAWSPSPSACAANVGTPCTPGPLRTGVALTADGVLDLDVRAVRVRGNVTVNGAALSSSAAQGSGVTFTRPDGSATVSLGTSGDARYDARLLPGTYDVAWSGVMNCRRDATAPCGGSTVRTGVALMNDGALDLDLRAVRVRGNVTVNGAPPDASSASRTLAFTSQGGAATRFTIGGGSPFDYAVLILPGTYTVALDGEGATCGAVGAGRFPCNGATLRTGLALMNDGALDLDVRAVQVRGTATVNGAPVTPWAGGFTFRLSEASTAQPSSSNGRYDVMLSPGTYSIDWNGRARCTRDDAFPCTPGTLREGVMLTADGVLDLDVRAVRVRGAVTLNGAPMPEGFARGAIGFSTSTEAAGATADIPTTGAATYGATVLPRAYHALHQGPDTNCTSVPCMNQVVRGCE